MTTFLFSLLHYSHISTSSSRDKSLFDIIVELRRPLQSAIHRLRLIRFIFLFAFPSPPLLSLSFFLSRFTLHLSLPLLIEFFQLPFLFPSSSSLLCFSCGLLSSCLLYVISSYDSTSRLLNKPVEPLDTNVKPSSLLPTLVSRIRVS